MSRYLRFVGTLVHRDIVRDLKSRETIVAMMIFSVLTIVVFSFAFDPDGDVARKAAPGMIWVMILFAGTLGLNTTFRREAENDAIVGLVLVPVDRSAIFLGKLIHGLIRLITVEVVSIPLMMVLFDLRLSGSLPQFVLVVLLASFGFVSVGTLLSALSTVTKWSDLLLPLVVFPVTSPVLIGAVTLTRSLFDATSAPLSPWLGMLVVFDIVFFTVPFLLFEYVLEV